MPFRVHLALTVLYTGEVTFLLSKEGEVSLPSRGSRGAVPNAAFVEPGCVVAPGLPLLRERGARVLSFRVAAWAVSLPARPGVQIMLISMSSGIRCRIGRASCGGSSPDGYIVSEHAESALEYFGVADFDESWWCVSYSKGFCR